MNGFGPEGGQILADCIKQNSALEEFNINSNRLNTPNAFAIAQALLSNDTLEVLKVITRLFFFEIAIWNLFKIANNQINCDGVLAVFLCVKTNEANTLREIDFSVRIIFWKGFNSHFFDLIAYRSHRRDVEGMRRYC